ncbi:MAG: PH domain-containing protein [Acidobacteriota bacterium]
MLEPETSRPQPFAADQPPESPLPEATLGARPAMVESTVAEPAAMGPSAEGEPTESSPAPEIADGRDRKLAPAAVTVARIAGLIWVTVLAIPLGLFGLLAVLFSAASARSLIALGIGGTALMLLALWCFIWPRLRYRHASYRVSDLGLWIRRGVLWRSEISVLKSRVQHTDVSQGPLQRRFDIATLVLHTAGTQHAAVSLGGLPHDVALAIRDYLIEGGENDAV